MINVHISKPSETKPVPKLMYELSVTSMHGDADLYTTQTRLCQSYDELINRLEVFKAFFDLSWNEGCDQDAVNNAIEKVDFKHGDVHEFYYDMVGWDAHGPDGSYATPDTLEVFRYDENGVKYDCVIDGMKTRRS